MIYEMTCNDTLMSFMSSDLPPELKVHVPRPAGGFRFRGLERHIAPASHPRFVYAATFLFAVVERTFVTNSHSLPPELPAGISGKYQK